MPLRARLSLAVLAALTVTACDPEVIGIDAGGGTDAGGDAGAPELACDNRERDGDETSIDCGGSCPACVDGENCNNGDDCQSKVCQRGRCLVPNCMDGVQNGDETGADCGGDCGLCPGGEPCTSNDQCLSARCRGGTCTMSDCEDGNQNGTETDVDCGGDLCPACSGGFFCDDGTDCISLICDMGTCTDAACNDGIQNQDETSVDCGGSFCPGCREGLACQIDADCLSTRCFDGGCVSCMDRIMNAEETGVDCGGGVICPACPDLEGCQLDSDCVSLACVDTDMDGSGDQCQSCSDGVQNQDESDIDCGGTACVGCPAGGTCTGDGDCDMGTCESGTCVNCLDNVLNQDETDVDCGGTVCLACGPGFTCGSGTDCASGVCTTGACVGLSPRDTFQITNFTDLACMTVERNPLSGDDRGGIGLTDQVVLYTGDSGTSRHSLDLTDGVRLNPPMTLSDAARYSMVTNMANGQIYSLANAGTPLGLSGGTITELIPVNDDGTLATTGRITLSMAITASGSSCCTGTIGIFAGWDRIVIHDGSSVWDIAIPSGTVTNLGTMSPPAHTNCEAFAYWGIAETDGANTNLVLVSNSTTISKLRVPTSAVVATFPFSNLGQICMFSGSVSRNRWYFQYESSTQFGSGTETIGYCNATFDTTAGNFTVTAMQPSGCSVNNYVSLVGDDRGGIAVNPSYIFYNGDSGLGRWSAADLSGGIATTSTGVIHEFLVSDLRNGVSYVPAGTTGPITSSGTATRLIQLDPATGQLTTTEVTLSAPITIPVSNTGMFSGWGKVLIHNNSRMYRIETPSGTVTDLGAMASPPHRGCEIGEYFGIAETFGGTEHVVVANTTNQIVRYAVPSGAVENTWPFTNLGDICAINFSPYNNRWYFAHEGTSQFSTGLIETLGYCRGVYGNP